jgi:sec-independent protein translocase protein TatA
MMPTLGAPELIIILVIIVLIFGVGKLPEVGQALGKGIREFRGAADGSEDESPQPLAKPAAPAPAPVAPAPVAVEAPRPAAVVEVPRPAPVVAAAAAPVAAAAPAPTTVAYIAVTGDTPEKIATSHGVTVEEILAANGWSRKDRSLDEGDRVLIPVKSA